MSDLQSYGGLRSIPDLVLVRLGAGTNRANQQFRANKPILRAHLVRFRPLLTVKGKVLFRNSLSKNARQAIGAT